MRDTIPTTKAYASLWVGTNNAAMSSMMEATMTMVSGVIYWWTALAYG